MARAGGPIADLSTLRALTFRISSTSTSQLPQQVSAIAGLLSNCRSLLASTQNPGSRTGSEASVTVHKFRSLLSTLLQDRTIEGRWTAIVLIKSTIEIGGWETLSKSLPWVRGLLGILTKPDPPSSKKLCLITLTRIFVLTQEYPTLVREITTSSLPTFIQSCLQLTTSKIPSELLYIILESFNQLLPRHPTIFRSFMKQLQQLLAPLVAPTPSSRLGKEQFQGLALASSKISDSARRLYVQLPCCAPKGRCSEEWETGFKNAIANTHRIADKVFRCVLEDWRSTSGAPSTVNGHIIADQVEDLETDTMALPPWSGIYAGGERLTGLLRLLKEYMASPTTGVVSIQIGVIADLLTRMFSITTPLLHAPEELQSSVRYNNQVSKEERDNLWALLPSVHVVAIEVLLSLLRRSANTTHSMDSVMLDQLVWVFNSEKSVTEIRIACYLAVGELLKRSGRTLPKTSTESLNSLIRACCGDILPQKQVTDSTKLPPHDKSSGRNQLQISANADTFLSASTAPKDPNINYTGLKQAANDLLPILLTNIRAQYLSDALRTRVDRTAILSNHKEAMIASVLNPPPSKKFGKPATSILPLLAKSFSGEKDVESLLRPRMPVIRPSSTTSIIQDDQDEQVAEDVTEEDDHFIGEELDTLLGAVSKAEPPVEDSRMVDAADEGVIPQVPSPPTVQPMPIEEGPGEYIASSTSQMATGNKRSPNEDLPPSPTKRVKVNNGEEANVTQSVASVPATITERPAEHLAPAIVVPPTVNHPLNATPNVEEDSDSDNFGELVLGQDTDEESNF
ncbi:hypothetical protein CC78DRAFT_535132 [Lojkania enalia]|uniref:Pre-rRNA-processing protein RIX1 n=1 Tax=Lojkania enalia TaxID=147567 RepID=A0A9P4K8P7_9PLEO|nr:hypothetical protein CC78DRAFT_535132 [Didymosphaeria enalia]